MNGFGHLASQIQAGTKTPALTLGTACTAGISRILSTHVSELGTPKFGSKKLALLKG